MYWRERFPPISAAVQLRGRLDVVVAATARTDFDPTLLSQSWFSVEKGKVCLGCEEEKWGRWSSTAGILAAFISVFSSGLSAVCGRLWAQEWVCLGSMTFSILKKVWSHIGIRRDVGKQNNGFDFRLAVILVHICRTVDLRYRQELCC